MKPQPRAQHSYREKTNARKKSEEVRDAWKKKWSSGRAVPVRRAPSARSGGLGSGAQRSSASTRRKIGPRAVL